MARDDFIASLQGRFSVRTVRAGTRAEQEQALSTRRGAPAGGIRLDDWREWFPARHPVYAWIIGSLDAFLASASGIPNINEVIFFDMHYELEGGRAVAHPDTGASFGHGVLTVYRRVTELRAGLPIARSEAGANYDTGVGAVYMNGGGGAPLDYPNPETSARRMLAHELGHGVQAPGASTDEDLANLRRFEAHVGWINGRLYDWSAPDMDNRILLGTPPGESFLITEANWNDPRWAEQPMSRYAVTGGPGEDFAETVMAFTQQEALLRARSPRRHAFMRAHLAGPNARLRYIPPGNAALGPNAGRTDRLATAGIATGMYIVVPDPEHDPMSYHRLTGTSESDYFGPRPAGVENAIVEVFHDQLGYYYPYHGRRTYLRERP